MQIPRPVHQMIVYQRTVKYVTLPAKSSALRPFICDNSLYVRTLQNRICVCVCYVRPILVYGDVLRISRAHVYPTNTKPNILQACRLYIRYTWEANRISMYLYQRICAVQNFAAAGTRFVTRRPVRFVRGMHANSITNASISVTHWCNRYVLLYEYTCI